MKRPPKYRTHSSGQARVEIDGITYYLGTYGSPESYERYERLLAEWRAGQIRPKPDPWRTVDEVLVEWYRSVESRLAARPSMRSCAIRTMAVLRRRYGRSPACEFDGRSLKVVRADLLERHTRQEANRRVRLIQSIWRWALSERLVPADAAASVQAVQALRLGDTPARESRDVQPVPRNVVEATLPYLPGYLPDAVRLQLATGCRPSEALRVRMADIEQRQSGLWIYRPMQHKTAHRGHLRQVFLGAEAIAILRRHIDATHDPADYLLSPRRARAERLAQLRATRKTPVQPSQRRRRKSRPRKQPGQHYSREYYTRAVAIAARKAGVLHWHPHQLRHTAATEFAARHGWEAARIWLGHRSLDATRIYADDDLERIARLLI